MPDIAVTFPDICPISGHPWHQGVVANFDQDNIPTGEATAYYQCGTSVRQSDGAIVNQGALCIRTELEATRTVAAKHPEIDVELMIEKAKIVGAQKAQADAVAAAAAQAEADAKVQP